MLPRLRIFLSSPADVSWERLRAHFVIRRLAREYRRYFRIEPFLWEYEPMLASRHFQDAVDPPGSFDMVVVALWSRLGTALPEKTAVREYRGIDGRAPVTGTEWEFEDALKANRASGGKVPELLVYRRMGGVVARLDDPKGPEEAIRQYGALERFWRRWFESDTGFLAGFATYQDVEVFERRLEADLRTLIERRVRDRSADPEPAIWLKNSPFRGLRAYDFDDATLFFGRHREIGAGLTQLLQSAENGTAFLLVTGPSGSGKSSLARAGLLPSLLAPKAVAGVGLWRRAIMRPGDAGGDPFLALARALAPDMPAEGEGLPELLGRRMSPADLAESLGAGGNPAFLFSKTLRDLADAERGRLGLLPHEEARLVLLIDQFEELITRAEIDAQQRSRFARTLATLASSGVVWVIATVRSDLWHRVEAIPEFPDLAEHGGRLTLSAPDAAQLLEMIRKPAQAAGLTFGTEPGSELSLDAVLASEANAQPGVLPLLSVILDELYERDVNAGGGSILTAASYRALGGLHGAIGKRAEARLQKIKKTDPAAAAALPKVLRSLVTVSTPGDAPATRSTPLKTFPEASPERRLVDALIAPDARLLTAEDRGRGPEVSLAHEALIEHWPTAKKEVADNAHYIRVRDEIDAQRRRFEAAGRRPELLLASGLPLAEARDLTKKLGTELAPELLAFINASRHRAIGSLVRAAAVAAIVLLAGSYGLWRWNQNLRDAEGNAEAKELLTSLQRGGGDLNDTEKDHLRYLINHRKFASLVLARSLDPDQPHPAGIYRATPWLISTAWGVDGQLDSGLGHRMTSAPAQKIRLASDICMAGPPDAECRVQLGRHVMDLLRTDHGNAEQVCDALVSLAAHGVRREEVAAWGAQLVKRMRTEQDAVSLAALGRALASLSPLGAKPEHIMAAGSLLLNQMRKETDPLPLRLLTYALAALATYGARHEDVSAAAARLVEMMRTEQDTLKQIREARRSHSLRGSATLVQSTRVLDELADGFAELAAQGARPEDVAAVGSLLVDKVGAFPESDSLPFMSPAQKPVFIGTGKTLADLAAHGARPDDVARWGTRLVELMRGEQDARPLAGLANTLAALDVPGVRPEDIAAAGSLLVERMQRPGQDSLSRAILAEPLTYLATHGARAEDVAAAGSLLVEQVGADSARGELGGPAQTLANLAANGARPGDVALWGAGLVRRMRNEARSQDLGLLAGQAHALAALASHGAATGDVAAAGALLLIQMRNEKLGDADLNGPFAALAGHGVRPEDVAEAGGLLVQRMMKTKQASGLRAGLAGRLAALAPYGARREDVATAGALLVESMRMDRRDSIGLLATALAALAPHGARLEDVVAAGTRLVDRMRTDEGPIDFEILANSLAALAARGARPEDVATAEELLAQSMSTSDYSDFLARQADALAALAVHGTRANDIRLANTLAARLRIEENPKSSAAAVVTIFSLPIDCESQPPLAGSDLQSLLDEFEAHYKQTDKVAVFVRLFNKFKCARTSQLMLMLHSFSGASSQGRAVLAAALHLKFGEPADSDLWHTIDALKNTDPLALREAAGSWQ